MDCGAHARLRHFARARFRGAWPVHRSVALTRTRATSARGSVAIPRFLIEREIPSAGRLSPAELQAVAQQSCDVLERMGPRIQWEHSYVNDDKVFCVYRAPDETHVREHAERGGFPANAVHRVLRTIDPLTAE